MDTETYTLLEKMHLDKVALIPIESFENKKLLDLKKDRAIKEYYATCKPFLIQYVMEKTEVEITTFLDADLYFFSPPESIYKEFGNSSVLIVPHLFPEKSDAAKTKGLFNAGMVMFRNDKNGTECLDWWVKSCNDWCYDRYENGKFADQMYIDSFPLKFKEVKVTEQKGINTAYWNIARYKFFKKDGLIWGKDKKTKEIFPLIFYHFSGVTLYKWLGKIRNIYCVRYIAPNIKKLIYNKYSETLNLSLNTLNKYKPNFNYGIKEKMSKEFLKLFWKKELISYIHIVVDYWREKQK
ncbi:MAG: hypothetical protein HQ402_03755 [Parcubacteria group bacterium]|nr:hypothetical protein [Parcubacteria group bacterium]